MNWEKAQRKQKEKRENELNKTRAIMVCCPICNMKTMLKYSYSANVYEQECKICFKPLTGMRYNTQRNSIMFHYNN